MRTLVHHTLKQWDDLLAEYNRVMYHFTGAGGDFTSAYESLLITCIEIIEKTGSNAELAEIRNMQAIFQLSKQGIHPFRLEKLQLGRRDLKNMMVYHGMEKICAILTARVQQNQKIIADARQILSDFMLSLIQSGTITDDLLINMKDIEVLSAFWSELTSANPQVMLLHKKLKLTLLSEDIYIILHDIISDLTQ